jgi:alpha-galactosidase/6-phospho-beta-glucosidase family protein
MGYNIALIGGGSLYTLPLVKTFVSYSKDFHVDRIKLFDIDKERQNLRYEAAKIVALEYSPDTVIEVSDSLDEAVTSVDYVLIQIRSGGLDGREKDERIPLLHGCIGQETCGAGGLVYGMRSIKDTLEIVTATKKHSPDAWIINYSNPASILAEATRRFFNDDKVVYLCDMTVLMQDGFEEALKLEKGELRPRYFGLNHFGWYTNLYDHKGNDRMPEIIELLKKGAIVPEELKNDPDWVKTFDHQSQSVRDFGEYIPSTYLEYYFYPKAVVRDADPNYTRASRVKEVKQGKVDEVCRKIIENRTTKDSGLQEGLYGKYIMDFILATTQDEYHREFLIPVRNEGAITNLSSDMTVEIPCLVNKNGIEKLFIGEVGYFYKGLMESLYASERLVVDGLLENDITKILKGFVLNRTINDADVAKELLIAMLEENKEFFPELYEQSKTL